MIDNTNRGFRDDPFSERSADTPAVKYRLGIDVGGTFTDAMIVNELTGETEIAKVPSTPSDPSEGFLRAVGQMLDLERIDAEAVSYLIHGTTVATNAIIEGKGARTGFITTQGFRDLLEIQRQIRPVLYDVMFDKTKPLVPRYLAHEVPERLNARGEVVIPLDEEAVRRAARELKAEGVEAISVCFLHAYVNGQHERRAAEIILDSFPEALISLSSKVAPEFREYYRASTTTINAAVQPLMKRYLSAIESRIRDRGVRGELLVMQSSGGVQTFGAAAETPVYMVESGPAAGVIAAAHLGTSLGFRNIISFDMGGTTAKTSLIQDGRPRVTKDYEVGSKATPGTGGSRGAGYPIKTPVIDLVEIGAGGGSIAWVDAGGVLRVGPQSAGADPGPVCYGRGGREPTVTDANVVLGRLDPDNFLGGAMRLDVEAAREAIERKCAVPLGMDVIGAANGIVEIANAAMVNALRLVSIQHGFDPREFALIGFGGAGPGHASRLAAEMQIPLTIIPRAPGIFSAMGLLVTDLRHDFSVTRIQKDSEIDPAEIGRLFDGLIEEGRSALVQDGLDESAMTFNREIDMRYVGQSYELSIPVSENDFKSDDFGRVAARFHNEHQRVYGFSTESEPVELVNFRLSAVGSINKPPAPSIEPVGPSGAAEARRDRRSIYYAEAGGFVDCDVYQRMRLGSGSTFSGPAVVEELDSTTVIQPGYEVRVDDFGNLHISPC
jgi:N-methylhydantoinase A